MRITASLTDSRLISVTCSAITVRICRCFGSAVAARCCAGILLLQNVLSCRLGSVAIGTVARMLVHAPAIAPQPLRDMFRRVVERAVGIRRFAFAAQTQAAAGMHVDVAGEEAAGAAERDLRLHRVVEILVGDNVQVIGHANPQRVR